MHKQAFLLFLFAGLLCAATPQLVIVAGNGQMQYASMNLMAPLTVKAVGADGSPLANVPLTWTVTSGAGTLVRSQLATDASGQASAVFRGDVQPGYS